jgi:hypothetical protein
LYKFDASTGVLTIDYEAVANKGWTDEEGDAFEEFISDLQENASTYQEALEGIDDANS